MKTIKVGEWYDWFIHFNKLENVSEGNINWKMLNQYGDYCKKTLWDGNTGENIQKDMREILEVTEKQMYTVWNI